MADLPRRNRIDQMFSAELAIREAVFAVERLGADVKLTEAVVLLGQAQSKVADYIDEHRVELAPRCYYFGCWNEAGHYLFKAGQHGSHSDDKISYYGNRVHLDGSLAPRKSRRGGGVVWAGMGQTQEARQRITYDSGECPQGQFLLHHLDNGFTAVQWWDRCQGDTRGACNSTVLLEGLHTAEEVLAAGREHFPHVFENLRRGGPEEKYRKRLYGGDVPLEPPVELVEVKP